MTYQHAVTTFSAFKFPDRAKLHLTCRIELCKGQCPIVDCKALQKPQQTRDGLLRKARLDKDAKGVVIDRLEVYNSIEVHAPNIELEDEASIRGKQIFVLQWIFSVMRLQDVCLIIRTTPAHSYQMEHRFQWNQCSTGFGQLSSQTVFYRQHFEFVLNLATVIKVGTDKIRLVWCPLFCLFRFSHILWVSFQFPGSRRIEDEEEFVRGFSPGDKTICMSPGKMALAFCVLGIIFLCAIAVAFVSLIRARRRIGREPLNTSLSFYTGSKSMFSSSESSSSGLSGSKLLLTDSPYFDHHSSSSNNWPYSRAFWRTLPEKTVDNSVTPGKPVWSGPRQLDRFEMLTKKKWNKKSWNRKWKNHAAETVRTFLNSSLTATEAWL